MPRTRITLAAMLFVAVTTLDAQEAPWPPPNHPRPALYGVIRDSTTGRAVGRVGLQVTEWHALGFGWDDGRYLLTGLTPGTRVVTFFCPTSRRLRGAKITDRTVELSATTDSVLNFTIDAHRCVEPPSRTWTGEFRGHYTYGFESSDFEPCKPFEDLHDTAFSYDSQQAWVGFDSAAAVRSKGKWPDTGDERYPKLYVRWRATVMGPGSYGHMGMALYGMMVTEVREVRRARANDCR